MIKPILWAFFLDKICTESPKKEKKKNEAPNQYKYDDNYYSIKP